MPLHSVGIPITNSEEADALRIEKRTGHVWVRRDGHVTVTAIGSKCLGPTCSNCGFHYCILCEPPEEYERCPATLVD